VRVPAGELWTLGRVDAVAEGERMRRCDNCGRTIIGGGLHEPRGSFCSKVCAEASLYIGFCQSCVESTLDVSSGSTATVNAVGTRLFGRANQCPTCRSVVQRLFFCILFVPVVPGLQFRVKYLRPDQFLSRQMPLSVEAEASPWRRIQAKIGLESLGLLALLLILGVGSAVFLLILWYLDTH